MIDISLIIQQLWASFGYIWVIIAGVVFGLTVGALPGFTTSNSLVVILPILISMEPISAIVLMTATYCGTEMGGSYPAIVLSVPGTAGAIPTTFDGHAMAKKGMAQQAIAISAAASGLGGFLTVALILLGIPFFSRVAVKFGTIQSFVIIMFGITLIARLGGKNFTKGLLMGFFGLLLGATGFDPIYNTPRATLGILQLYDGIPTISALIGLFGLSECLMMLRTETIVDQDAIETVIKGGIKQSWEGVKMTVRYWKTLIRSSLIGLFVGAIPGAGGTISALLAYQQEVSANPGKKFGEGEPRGVLAPEAANNAMIAGVLVPTFSLGIPGSNTAVVILIVMEAHGYLIGPQFLKNNTDIFYLIATSMIFANFFIFFTGFFSARYVGKLTLVPTRILVPSIIALCLIGANARRGYIFDIYLALIFGVLGYILRRFDYPLTPLVIGIVLGPYAEEYFLRGLRLGHGNPLIFFRDPLSLLIWGTLILSFVVPIIRQRIKNAKKS